MRKIIFLLFFISFLGFSQNHTIPFKHGEFLKMDLSYGFISAGFATFEVNELKKNNRKLIHVNGNGWSTGMTDFFFHVEDNYQTFFDKYTFQPYHFIRRVDEGGHTKNKEIFFNHTKNRAIVKDHKRNTKRTFSTQKDVHDMLSSLYYLRSINFDNFNDGDVFTLKLFYDDSVNDIKLRFKGREVINTNFGKIKTIVLKPQVETGRIFDEKEGVTIWLTDDKNKIPVKIKASVLVGSIKAELIEYKGLANEFSESHSNF
ncbi:MAG: DUF3108 domain-containing protein [Bacteroidota bacterium]